MLSRRDIEKQRYKERVVQRKGYISHGRDIEQERYREGDIEKEIKRDIEKGRHRKREIQRNREIEKERYKEKDKEIYREIGILQMGERERNCGKENVQGKHRLTDKVNYRNDFHVSFIELIDVPLRLEFYIKNITYALDINHKPWALLLDG